MMKNTKTALSLAMVSMILLSLAMVNRANAIAALYVSPPATEGTLGSTFNVDIKLDGVANLAGFEFKLFWNSTLLQLKDVNIFLPWSPNFIAKNDTTVAGRWWLAASLLAPASPFTGDTILASASFKSVYQPFFPEPDGFCLLDLVDTKLGDPAPNPIAHTVTDGTYHIAAVLPPSPEMAVVPPVYTATNLGEVFPIDVEIQSLASGWGLYGWEAKMRYNTTLLDVLNVVEGPFLPAFAGGNGTFFIAKYGSMLYAGGPATYEDMGLIHMAGLFLGSRTSPFGTGAVATITFNATYRTLYPVIASCPLDLHDTKMVDAALNGIGHITSDGLYNAPYKKLGRQIDVFTENTRWPDYTTPYTRENLPGGEADAFTPQEEICLYARVTYNEDPVANKLVAFEIRGPINGIQNVTIIRTAMTNASGIAVVCFRVPSDPATTFGLWTVEAIVEIAEESVSDTVSFMVGWIVEIVGLKTVDEMMVAKASFKKGEHVNFNLTWTNIGMIPRTVTYTIAIYDDLGVPIGQIIMNGFVVPPATMETFHLDLLIPMWAFVGVGTAYGDVLTGLPSAGGVPYAPEISTTFQIARP